MRAGVIPTRNPRRMGKQVARVTFLSLLAFLALYPVIFIVITSFKSLNQFYANFWFPSWPPDFSNYSLAWHAVSGYLLNSMLVTTLSTLGVVTVSCLAAYAFARFQFPGRHLLYYFVIFLLMVPAVLTLVPSFLLVKDLGLLNTRWALVLPYIATGQVLGIFILRQFFAGLPEEMFEAARIDGASEFRAFWRIGVPLVRPTLVTVAILEVLVVWNDYLWPFVVTRDKSVQTVVVGLVEFQTRFYTNWGALMAGYVIAAAPLLLLFALAMRSFIRGLTQGGLKA
jgi:ABC-type glycerol-3-phosphate transport system permease component